MWFLNSTPETVDLKILVEAFGKSYQLTSLQFCIKNTDYKEIYIAMPFPWSVDKENGSFKVVRDERLDKILNSEAVHLQQSDITLYENARKLKKSDNQALLDFPTIRELWDIYTEEDFGVFVVKVSPGVTYRIDYTHKLSIFSTLFVQTRFSNLHNMKKNNFSAEIFVINGRADNVAKFLSFVKYTSSGSETVDRYTIKPSFDWCEDVRFGTHCWESSDESGDSDERFGGR
jgi:hypothetical protein